MQTSTNKYVFSYIYLILCFICWGRDLFIGLFFICVFIFPGIAIFIPSPCPPSYEVCDGFNCEEVMLCAIACLPRSSPAFSATVAGGAGVSTSCLWKGGACRVAPAKGSVFDATKCMKQCLCSSECVKRCS